MDLTETIHPPNGNAQLLFMTDITGFISYQENMLATLISERSSLSTTLYFSKLHKTCSMQLPHISR